MKKNRAFTLIELLVVITIISILGSIALPAALKALKAAKQTASVNNARNIGQLLFLAANDREGEYPDAETATEICQYLVSNNYLNDPEILYSAAPGKTKATTRTLAAANLSYAITGNGVNANSGDQLPLIITAGNTIDAYKPGMSLPLSPQNTWGPDGLVVITKGCQGKWLKANAAGVVDNFISGTFPEENATYKLRQP
jgi:prepilin-type N-terminal cleavage/methylation domain-containing protein